MLGWERHDDREGATIWIGWVTVAVAVYREYYENGIKSLTIINWHNFNGE